MKSFMTSSGIIATTALLLLGMLFWGWTAPFRSGPEVESYFAAVADKIDEIPHQIGPWLGVDIPVTPAATELLKPNKLIQRRYNNAQTGESFELLIVHCGNVRDMVGHYPPVCYPAHGWKLKSKQLTDIETPGIRTQASLYSFSRQSGLVRDSIRILNFFVLPASDDPSFGPELDLIEQAGLYHERARLGAAQVQVITSDKVTPDRSREIIRIAMLLAEEALHEVERGLE